MSDDNRIDDLIIKGIDRVEDKIEKVQDKVSAVEGEVRDLNTKFGQHEELFKSHLETDKKMYEEFSRMNGVLRENTDSLKEHMRRTAILEDIVKPIQEERLKKQAVKDYISERWKKWFMYLSAVSTALGIIGKILGFF